MSRHNLVNEYIYIIGLLDLAQYQLLILVVIFTMTFEIYHIILYYCVYKKYKKT